MRRPAILIITFAALSLFAGVGGAGAQQEDAPRLELGLQFSSLSLNEAGSFADRAEPGVGGRLTYNLTDHVAVEAEGNFFPRRRRFPVTESAGRVLQGQFGVKAGRRFERFGVFAKARPGFVNFSDAVTDVSVEEFTFEGGRFFFPNFKTESVTRFSADLGGVVEFYPSRRILARLDFGDTIIRYGGRPDVFFVSDPDSRPVFVQRPAATRHNFQFSAGIGFRF